MPKVGRVCPQRAAGLQTLEGARWGQTRPTLSQWFLLLFTCAALSTGCAYTLGPTNGQIAGAKSVQVNPFANNALEPRLTEYVTSSIRKSLQRDGTFRLDTKREGDIVLNGTILKFDRTELSFQPGDIITPRDYRVSIIAQINARERATGKVLVEREVTGYTTVRIGADLSSAERQAVPLIADDLGRKIASILSEGAW